MNLGHFSPDTAELIRLFARRSVDWVLVGGEAVIYYGYARLTGDVDFYYRRSDDNVARVFAALQDFWGGRVPNLASADELLREGLVLQFGRPPNRIDLLNQISGVTFEQVWEGSVEVPLAGRDAPPTLRLIGFKELLQNKRASGRHKDLDDVEMLTRGRD